MGPDRPRPMVPSAGRLTKRPNECTEQIGPERYVLGALGVPLHTKIKNAGGVGDRFDDAVGCTGEHNE